MSLLASIIRTAFTVYTLMILIRVIGSWFPNIQHYKIMQFIAYYVDPYLNLFRRFIPPIGGVLDLSPLIAFFVLQLVQRLLLRFL